MRILSLLITLLIVAYLIYAQLGSDKSAPAAQQATYVQAEQKAAAVETQVQDQFSQQADQLTHMETGDQASAP